MSDLIKAKSKLYWALMDASVEDALKNGFYLNALMSDPDLQSILKYPQKED